MCTHPTFRTKRKIRTHLPLGRYSSVILICERVIKRSRIEVRVSKSGVAIKNIAYTPVLLLIH